MTDTKICLGCNRLLPPTEFHHNRTRKDNLQDWCKSCKATCGRERGKQPRVKAMNVQRTKKFKEQQRDKDLRGFKMSEMLAAAHHRARRDDLEYSITELDFPDYRDPNLCCPYFGVLLVWDNRGRSDSSPSIDRIDNTKGYVPGNVRIVSWHANVVKGDGTAEEHRLIAETMIRMGCR